MGRLFIVLYDYLWYNKQKYSEEIYDYIQTA